MNATSDLAIPSVHLSVTRWYCVKQTVKVIVEFLSPVSDLLRISHHL